MQPYWPMQKKLLQLQPHILLNKCHRRPGQPNVHFWKCVDLLFPLLLLKHLPNHNTDAVLSPSLLPTSAFLINLNRNNTKPKQESQFDFKPPTASQVRYPYPICVIYAVPCMPAGNLYCGLGNQWPSRNCSTPTPITARGLERLVQQQHPKGHTASTSLPYVLPPSSLSEKYKSPINVLKYTNGAPTIFVVEMCL